MGWRDPRAPAAEPPSNEGMSASGLVLPRGLVPLEREGRVLPVEAPPSAPPIDGRCMRVPRVPVAEPPSAPLSKFIPPSNEGLSASWLVLPRGLVRVRDWEDPPAEGRVPRVEPELVG